MITWKSVLCLMTRRQDVGGRDWQSLPSIWYLVRSQSLKGLTQSLLMSWFHKYWQIIILSFGKKCQIECTKYKCNHSKIHAFWALLEISTQTVPTHFFLGQDLEASVIILVSILDLGCYFRSNSAHAMIQVPVFPSDQAPCSGYLKDRFSSAFRILWLAALHSHFP